MSARNVEIVKRVMELFGRAQEPGAGAEIRELVSPVVVIDMTRRVFNPDTYEGHAGLDRLGEEIAEVWDEFKIEPERFIDAGDRVVVIETRRGRGTGSGVEVEMRSGVIWTLRDGQVVGLQTDLEPDEAIAAAAS
jgi:ketosteroid isomerase-like protein